MTQRRYSSLLELEAADYFKLDLSQVQMFNGPNSSHRSSRMGKHKINNKTRKQVVNQTSNHERVAKIGSNVKQEKQTKTNQQRRTNNGLGQNSYLVGGDDLVGKDGQLLLPNLNGSARTNPDTFGMDKNEIPITVMATSPYLADSSTASTNSLPSISSSPSVSPSLLCPHLSLDDILALRNESKSPHTIGLCKRCRVDPPPDIHSPLSPAFKPSKNSQQTYQSNTNLSKARAEIKPLRRGYSDQQAAARPPAANQDSLDYYVEPRELRRLQLSPIVRNSVEFIRKSTAEAGRVLRIYKNGEPFEKPLRICVSRGEFATLNNLLDFIGSRQLVPSGARYLFHLDGQLVYSVNELKHASIYIVSGTRKFDHNANSILKEQFKRELESSQAGHRRTPAQQSDTTLDSPNPAISKPLIGGRLPVNLAAVATDAQTDPEHIKLGQSTREKMPILSTARQKDISDAPTTKLKQINREALDNAQRSVTIVKQKPARVAGAIVSKKQSTADQNGRQSAVSTLGRKASEKSVSKSNESMEKPEQRADERPVSLVRAKSELGSSPSKKRKNVTFVDALWDSSNMATATQSEQDLSKVDRSSEGGDDDNKDDADGGAGVGDDDLTSENIDVSLEALRTSEIGIQVSDSMEGFLIDLPIPLPPKGDELKDQKRAYLKKGQGARAIKTSSQITHKKHPAKTATFKQTPKPARRVVTISERQLSLDEMYQLKDMDHGDHHSESNRIQHVTITLEGADDLVASDDEQELNKKSTDKLKSTNESENIVIVDDPSETINIGQVDKTPLPQQQQPSGSDEVDHSSDDLRGASETGWQYPGGRQSSATPTERSISQSEANESVHACVTTPTPSVSTNGGDSIISISHDSAAAATGAVAVAGELTDDQRRRSELAQTKTVVPVLGKLCQGVDPPGRNFKLAWVNGFAINDHYPDNSPMMGIQAPDSAGGGLLSPSQSNQRSYPNQFKPSDRFHNWVCHARRHDELIYPAGVLIVLWCKQTNEQRYYSKHTANVSCIALNSIDEDLAASGQLGAQEDPAKRKIGGGAGSVHIWSLSSLDTLRVIEDEQFSGKKMLSLRLRNTAGEGCELSVAAKDDKRIWAFLFYMNLNNPKQQTDDEVGDKAATTSHSITVMRASKVLQTGQIPLLLLKVSNQKERISVPVDSNKQPLDDLLITFGRRHLQVWFANRKQRKLDLLSIDKRSSQFVELIARANCIAQMSPVEYLVGDAVGSIALLMVNSMIKPSSKFNLSSSSRLALSEDKYSVETMPLYVASDDVLEASPLNKKANSITCLTRISGNIFASGDSTCTVKFWHIDRRSNQNLPKDSSNLSSGGYASGRAKCRLLNSISLPRDLGFICTIIKSNYNRKQSTVEFYAISTSNAILFGSIQLQQTPTASVHDSASSANPSSISVLYEGHETFAINLVADCVPPPPKPSKFKHNPSIQTTSCYFTCSLDYKICKWSGKNLVWKSMLPSACASMAVHPVGFVLAVGSADGTVYILDKISGLLISYFPLTPVCINCLAYSRDGLLLAAGCANGSIFILPVYERGLKYKKVSIFQSPYPVVSLQFSNNSRYILTSVTNGPYQELILWDLPNFRYMRDYVKVIADKISWFDAICSGSEDVRAIWENANLANEDDVENLLEPAAATGRTKPMSKRQLLNVGSNMTDPTGKVVNLSCHRLIRSGHMMATTTESASESQQQASHTEDLAIASDTRGCLRLFRYPCYDIQQGFYEFRLSLSPVNCCRFLSHSSQSTANRPQVEFVSTSLDGSICLWSID